MGIQRETLLSKFDDIHLIERVGEHDRREKLAVFISSALAEQLIGRFHSYTRDGLGEWARGILENRKVLGIFYIYFEQTQEKDAERMEYYHLKVDIKGYSWVEELINSGVYLTLIPNDLSYQIEIMVDEYPRSAYIAYRHHVVRRYEEQEALHAINHRGILPEFDPSQYDTK